MTSVPQKLKNVLEGFTKSSREVIKAEGKEDNLKISQSVSAALVKIVRSLK